MIVRESRSCGAAVSVVAKVAVPVTTEPSLFVNSAVIRLLPVPESLARPFAFIEPTAGRLELHFS